MENAGDAGRIPSSIERRIRDRIFWSAAVIDQAVKGIVGVQKKAVGIAPFDLRLPGMIDRVAIRLHATSRHGKQRIDSRILRRAASLARNGTRQTSVRINLPGQTRPFISYIRGPQHKASPDLLFDCKVPDLTVQITVIRIYTVYGGQQVRRSASRGERIRERRRRSASTDCRWTAIGVRQIVRRKCRVLEIQEARVR